MPLSRSIMIEARAMIALALPVVLDQLGLISMTFVDTIMVGRLGSEALGAVGIGGALYFFYMVFAFGVISAVGPTVAQAFGGGDHEEIARNVGQAFWLAAGLTIVGLIFLWNAGEILRALGQPPELIPLAEEFVRSISFGMIANLCYASLRAFTTGLGRTRVTMVISICASILNIGVDYALIYGRFGLPALGVAGAGYASAIVQWVMLGMMIYYVLSAKELRIYRFYRHIFPFDRVILKRLFLLGSPIGLGNSMEVGIFATTSLLMGTIGTVPLAAHQVALNVASFTFMIPVGIATAISTRIGQAIGRGEPRAAELAGWVGIGIAAIFMTITALLFVSIPRTVISIYTSDEAILGYASGLLMIAGAFQIFDGTQVAALGALRGLKDTARPMMINLLSYWFVGMPVSWALAFPLGAGGPGLWWGLTTGLAVAAVLHSVRFRKLTKDLRLTIDDLRLEEGTGRAA